MAPGSIPHITATIQFLDYVAETKVGSRLVYCNDEYLWACKPSRPVLYPPTVPLSETRPGQAVCSVHYLFLLLSTFALRTPAGMCRVCVFAHVTVGRQVANLSSLLIQVYNIGLVCNAHASIQGELVPPFPSSFRICQVHTLVMHLTCAGLFPFHLAIIHCLSPLLRTHVKKAVWLLPLLQGVPEPGSSRTFSC